MALAVRDEFVEGWELAVATGQVVSNRSGD
jgi:hypothetical protein